MLLYSDKKRDTDCVFVCVCTQFQKIWAWYYRFEKMRIEKLYKCIIEL